MPLYPPGLEWHLDSVDVHKYLQSQLASWVCCPEPFPRPRHSSSGAGSRALPLAFLITLPPSRWLPNFDLVIGGGGYDKIEPETGTQLPVWPLLPRAPSLHSHRSEGGVIQRAKPTERGKHWSTVSKRRRAPYFLPPHPASFPEKNPWPCPPYCPEMGLERGAFLAWRPRLQRPDSLFCIPGAANSCLPPICVAYKPGTIFTFVNGRLKTNSKEGCLVTCER